MMKPETFARARANPKIAKITTEFWGSKDRVAGSSRSCVASKKKTIPIMAPRADRLSSVEKG